MDADPRPHVLALRVPDVEERVDAITVQRLSPRRPVEGARRPACFQLTPTSLVGRRVGVAVQPPVYPLTPYRQEGEPEEREHLDDRIDPFLGIV